MMDYGTVQMVLLYAMMGYYQTKLDHFECEDGSWCSAKESVCHCWSGPAVNLLCWLVLLLSREFTPWHAIEYQVIGKAVYARVKREDTGTWLFPLRQGDYADLEPALTPVICWYERKHHLEWTYAGYPQLRSINADIAPLLLRIFSNIRNMVPLRYFIYAAYITLNRRDEQEKQKMLLTALFLARPLICRRFCDAFLQKMKDEPSVWADQSVLLFIGRVLQDLSCSMYEVLRDGGSPSYWSDIGYYDTILQEFGLDDQPTLTGKFQKLFTASCNELLRYVGLGALWNRVNSTLPQRYFMSGGELERAKVSFQELNRLKNRNPALRGG